MQTAHAIDATARPVGQTPAVIDRRAGDARAYLIDCAPLLRKWELMARARVPGNPPQGLSVTARPLSGGTVLEVRIAGGPEPTSKRPLEIPLRLTVVTSQGAIEVALTVRVHG